jgi:glutaredoxin 3
MSRPALNACASRLAPRGGQPDIGTIMSGPSAKVVIYTTATCGFCHAAKRLLDQKGVAYEEVAVDRRPDLRDWLRSRSGQNTVPQVFINGAPIGGYSELSGHDRRGTLASKLATPPAVDNPAVRS